MMKNWLSLKTLVAVSAVALLSACGGGSGDSSPPTYTVGGQVTGLSLTSSVTLLNNGADAITVSANGEYTFATKIAQGSAYAVTVQTQPVGQTCSVTNGMGAASSNVTNVVVACANKPAKFAYVTDPNTSSVLGFSVDGATGALTSFSEPYTRFDLPFGIAATASGKFVYVANINSTISASSINGATGALTPVGDFGYVDGTPYSIAADPTGRFIYVTSAGRDLPNNNTVAAYSINSATGALAAIGNPVSTGIAPYFLAIDPTGKYLYVSNYGDNSLSMFAINSATGSLTAIGSPVPTDTYPNGITVDPLGRFVYVTTESNKISIYSINKATGVLTSIGSAATGNISIFITVDPAGKFVYNTNMDDNTVSVYKIDQTTGLLTQVETVATGASPYGVNVDPTGKYLYVANFSGNSVSTYSINSATGGLTNIGTNPGAGSPAVILLTAGPN